MQLQVVAADARQIQRRKPAAHAQLEAAAGVTALRRAGELPRQLALADARRAVEHQQLVGGRVAEGGFDGLEQGFAADKGVLAAGGDVGAKGGGRGGDGGRRAGRRGGGEPVEGEPPFVAGGCGEEAGIDGPHLGGAVLVTNREDAQLGAISADIRTLLASINTAANPKRLESIANNMDQTVIASRTLMDRATEDLTRMNAILAQLQATLDTNRPHIDTTMGALATTALKADAFMTQSHTTMFEMQATIKELQERLAVTAENLEQTSSNLNSLITNAKDQPSLLIFGQPKPPRKVEE